MIKLKLIALAALSLASAVAQVTVVGSGPTTQVTVHQGFVTCYFSETSQPGFLAKNCDNGKYGYPDYDSYTRFEDFYDITATKINWGNAQMGKDVIFWYIIPRPGARPLLMVTTEDTSNFTFHSQTIQL